MAGVRDYNFVSGVETDDLPTATDPSVSSDYVNKGYADANYGDSSVNLSGTHASPTSITAGGGITPTSGKRQQMMYIQGSGGAVTVTANPQIVAGSIDGQSLRLVGCSDTNTVKLQDGTGLKLNGSITLGDYWVIGLFWSASQSVWVEEYRREN